MMPDQQKIMVRGQMRHQPVAVGHPDDPAIQAVGSRVLRVAGQLPLDDGHRRHVGVQLG